MFLNINIFTQIIFPCAKAGNKLLQSKVNIFVTMVITSTQKVSYFPFCKFQGIYYHFDFAEKSSLTVTNVLLVLVVSSFLKMQLPWLIIASLGSISMLFTIISLATTAWVVAGLEGVGLWQACTDSVCIAIPSNVGEFCPGCRRS